MRRKLTVTWVVVADNPLTSLTVTGNPRLEHLGVSRVAALPTVDLSRNPNLDSLTLWAVGLRSIGLGSLPVLRQLVVRDNALTALSVSSNRLLEFVDASRNQLTAIDFRNNPALDDLWISDNQLTALDVTQNPLLTRIFVSQNQLTSLDLTAQRLLNEVDLTSNLLDTAAVDAVITQTLLQPDAPSGYGHLMLEGNAPPSAQGLRDIAALEARGWTVLHD